MSNDENNNNISIATLLLTPYAVQVGVTFLIGQCCLYCLFATNFFGLVRCQGPWTKMPGFTAHQVIVIPVLFFLSWEGILKWWFFNQGSQIDDDDATAAAVDRLLVPRNGYFSEFVLGMMLFWDIPTGLLTPALRDVPMIVHHVGMCCTAATSMGILSGPGHKAVMGYYAPFFFGLIELSSIPLIVVDLFHPKHKAWYEYLTGGGGGGSKNKNNNSTGAPVWLSSLNDVSRIVFAVAFFVFRTLYFPYVTFTGVLPDVIQVAALEPAARDNISLTPLYVMAVLNVLFSCLQFYWGFLLLRQVLKLLRSSCRKGSSAATYHDNGEKVKGS